MPLRPSFLPPALMRSFARAAAIRLAAALLLCCSVIGARAAPAPAVLVLLSTGYGQTGIDNYVKGLYAVLSEAGLPYTQIHIEYLDLVKHGDVAHRERLAGVLDGKYAGARIGAVVAVQPPALAFLLREGRAIAPGAPVLVAQARPPAGADTGGRRLLFQTPQLDFAGTLARALELFPETRRVVLLSGASEVEQGRLHDAKQQFARWQGQLEFEYTDGWRFDEIERRLAATPPGTVIIAPGVNRDAAGKTFVPVDTIVRIAQGANAPVFPVYSVSIGRGPVGGMVSVLEDEGRTMAATVLQALRLPAGADGPLTIPATPPVALFDWQQIQRWGGDASRLPPQAVFLNRPPTLWSQYQGYVVGGGLAIVLLTALVVALALQNRRRRIAETSLRASERRYRLLADNISDVLWIYNLRRDRLEYVSPSVEKLRGYGADEALSQGMRQVLTPASYATLEEAFAGRLRDYRADPQAAPTYTDAVEVLRRDGSTIWVELATRFVRTEQGELALLGMSRDISQRRAAEQEITQLAFYDTLTGLPNRRLLLDRAQHALAASARSQRWGALLFIDLDNFKTLNDTRGHELGDLLLQQVARRLKACVREGDTVARLGGDEFVLMLENLDPSPSRAGAEAEAVGEKILAALACRCELDGQTHHGTASMGITLFSGQRDSVDELLRRADLAMYRAKAAGRNTLRFFDPEMQATVAARAMMESELRAALAGGQLLLHYQPQVLADGRLVGAEALVRWQHPERGLVGPGEFIPLAEDTGLILGLGQWVLEAACAQLVAWSQDPATAALSVAVNVSPRQFRRAEFVAEVLVTLQRSGAAPQRLKLELTESLLLDDLDQTIARMAQLRAHGVSFALDDFGTGYSSLAYLKRLPLEQLKIDRSFVRDVLEDPSDAAIARTVIALGQSLGLTVLAEGVETEGQRDFLAGHGCHAFQGYLLGRPMPAADFDAYARRHGAPV
jgi:diguanylate cyclase (GGDEF)-like protein/PAS domain S-box-containing protein